MGKGICSSVPLKSSPSGRASPGQLKGCQRNSVRSPWNDLDGAGGWMRCSAGRAAPGRASFSPFTDCDPATLQGTP